MNAYKATKFEGSRGYCRQKAATLRLLRPPLLRGLLPARCWEIPEEGLTIGRGTQNGLRIRGRKNIQAVHAWVYRRDTRWYVESLGGTVYIDDKPVFGRARLHDGALVRIDQTLELVFEVSGGEG